MPGTVKKVLVWLGLEDDDELDTEGMYEPEMSAPSQAQSRRWAAEQQEAVAQTAMPAVRPMSRDQMDPSGEVTIRPALRPLPSVQAPKVHVVIPEKFSDAKDVGDHFKARQPVIVKLDGADRDLARRMIDFCSGVTYALGGSMEKVADQVFLLTPTNVEISAEEKRRLAERGLYRAN